MTALDERPVTATACGFPELLEALGFGPDDPVTVCHQPPGGRFEVRWTTAARAPAVADEYPGENVWFNVNGLAPKDCGRGGVADVSRWAALHVDLDVKRGGMASETAAVQVVTDLSTLLGTKPAMVVLSGHGLQPYWPLEVDEDSELTDDTRGQAVALLRRFGRLAAHVAGTRDGHVDSVFDLARVLRVPGSMNVKDPVKPVPVTVSGCEDFRPLSVAEVDEVLNLYGAVEQPGDRDAAGGEIVAPAADWAWATSSHPAVAKAVTSWSRAIPKERHPWLLGVATSLAFARRLGMVTEDDHRGAVVAVAARFRWLLAHQTPPRAETPGEVADCLSHGVNVAQSKSDTDVAADWAFWIEVASAGAVAVLEPAEVDDFWEARPVLTHVRNFARARMVSPWALLGVVLARVVTAVPPYVVLPPIVGSTMSLNSFLALTGPSGAGKGAALSAGGDAVDVGHITVATVGSGEGIAHLYAHREKGAVIRDVDAVLFDVPEVDNLTALGSRRGATLMPQLRSAWTGETLGFSYADRDKRLPIERHSYRLGLVLGVQPGRAGPLLDDSDGGTPQRFVWLPTTDPDAPEVPPPCPEPMAWNRWHPWHADARGLVVMPVPEVARQTIIGARRDRLRGGDALDGHALLARLKVAAALALLDDRQAIGEEDWDLAGTVMRVSDATRAGVVRFLATRAQDANRMRGEAEAQRAVVVSETVEAAAVRRTGQTILRHLRDGEATWSDARRRLTSGLRQHFEAAVDNLIAAGAAVIETTERGKLIKLTEDVR